MDLRRGEGEEDATRGVAEQGVDVGYVLCPGLQGVAIVDVLKWSFSVNDNGLDTATRVQS